LPPLLNVKPHNSAHDVRLTCTLCVVSSLCPFCFGLGRPSIKMLASLHFAMHCIVCSMSLESQHPPVDPRHLHCFGTCQLELSTSISSRSIVVIWTMLSSPVNNSVSSGVEACYRGCSGHGMRVLLYCVCRLLDCCILPLLDILMRSTTDKFSDDVAAKSRAALSRFSEHRLASGSRPLIESLEENVFNLATKLPNQMSCPGDVIVMI